MEGVEGDEGESAPAQGFSLLKVSQATDAGNEVFIPFWIRWQQIPEKWPYNAE